jgi:predicted neuraminidase
VSYSYHLARKDVPLDSEGQPARKAIKHARFNTAWVRQGDPR